LLSFFSFFQTERIRRQHVIVFFLFSKKKKKMMMMMAVVVVFFLFQTKKREEKNNGSSSYCRFLCNNMKEEYNGHCRCLLLLKQKNTHRRK